ncbi:iron ABC transporter substrate-binding protein [Haloechinothrix sp. LS1_15]|uniref:iron ABC transporter substrate-binding protein n=1 Tax=Haloechinothrix sp. LS1_15 TaxID=2652248 RepID=UPI002947D73A|nr:iron ABC transporter substrate-binding protein [Haloechinothrix sp. LS1_15]MDV6012424.1 iron ABC transporter substrate-binding protein [Haloechinothrix sp. LS1_15]
MRRPVLLRFGALAAGAVLLPALAACGTDEENGGGDAAAENGEGGTLTIYSGRNEELVGGILDELEEATGRDVEVRYGDSAEMAAQLLEEGDATDADLFFSQDAGALGALSQQGMLAELPDEVLDVVPERFRAEDDTWAATSARARVIAYNAELVDEAELPDNLDELVDERWRGEVGFAPTNASWQAFVTGLRVLEGDDGARDWLMAFRDNEPEQFENNSSTLEGVDNGEVSLGLINHYYHHALVEERGEDNVDVEIHYAEQDDPLALVNIAGVGILNSSDNQDAAEEAAAFLVSEDAQQYFADETAEYAVRDGVTSTVHDLPPIDELPSPDIDLSELAPLEETLEMLQDVGLS